MPKRNSTVSWFASMAFRPCQELNRWVHRLQNAGWLQAIASAAPRANVEAILTSLSATHIFQSIVSAEDVHHGKPDPEVYLVAASRVGVSPDCCIVVEDAAAGVEGARRAAMKSIGVNGNGGYLPADIAVKSLELLEPNAFETLLESRAATTSTTPSPVGHGRW